MPNPTFLIIGAPRCGTTTLHRALNQHPGIYLPPNKEPGYFAFATDRGHPPPHVRDFYITTWTAYQRCFDNASQARAIGEATPFYLAFPRAAKCIRDMLPDARLLICLRNPAERSYSHYLFHRRTGKTMSTSFEEALENQHELKPGGWSQAWALKEFGNYGKQLQCYYELFSKEQIKVFLFEDLTKDFEHLYREILAFVGVNETIKIESTRALNQGGIRVERAWFRNLNPRMKSVGQAILPNRVKKTLRGLLKYQQSLERPTMPQDIRHQLVEYYRDSILNTQQLIGRDLSHWLR